MMSKEKWVESLLDDMVESQWSEDIITGEYGHLSRLAGNDGAGMLEDLEPINQFSQRELLEQQRQLEDFNAQIENFSKRDYENHLISEAVRSIQKEECFEKIEFSDDYLEGLIRQHLDEEKRFLDRDMKEAIAEENHFQEYVEKRLCEEHFPDISGYDDEEDFYLVEYPVERDVFDDLGDACYMNQGIFEGADTDSLEEPFRYSYYEELFERDLPDCGYDDLKGIGEDYDKSSEFIDISEFPDDLNIEEPACDYMEGLIRERLFEERHLDRIFVEIIRRESYWDDLIRQKLANDEKLDAKIRKFH